MRRIQHYPGCTADYPEKVDGEAPQAIQVVEIDDGEEVHQCVDCGAFVIERPDPPKGTPEKPVWCEQRMSACPIVPPCVGKCDYHNQIRWTEMKP